MLIHPARVSASRSNICVQVMMAGQLLGQAANKGMAYSCKPVIAFLSLLNYMHRWGVNSLNRYPNQLVNVVII
jgi:hypothetical protein